MGFFEVFLARRELLRGSLQPANISERTGLLRTRQLAPSGVQGKRARESKANDRTARVEYVQTPTLNAGRSPGAGLTFPEHLAQLRQGSVDISKVFDGAETLSGSSHTWIWQVKNIKYHF